MLLKGSEWLETWNSAFFSKNDSFTQNHCRCISFYANCYLEPRNDRSAGLARNWILSKQSKPRFILRALAGPKYEQLSVFSGTTLWTNQFVPSFVIIAKCSYVCNKIFNELFYRGSYTFDNWRMSLSAYPRTFPVLAGHIRSRDVRASKNIWWIVTVANRKLFKSDYDWIYSRIPTKRTFFSWFEKKLTFWLLELNCAS